MHSCVLLHSAQGWRVLTSRPLRSARIELDSVPGGVDLRLALIRRSDRLESSQSFVIPVDRRAVLHISIPAARDEAQIAARPIGDLPIHMQLLTDGGSELELGFTWR